MQGLEATTHLLKISLFHHNPAWEHAFTPAGSIVSLNPAAPAVHRKQEQQRVARLLQDRDEAMAVAWEVA